MQQVADYNSFATDKVKFNKALRGSNMRERINRMEAVWTLYKISNLSTEDKIKSLVHLARNTFEKNFTVSIASLLKNFPSDFTDDRGVRFWTAPKMCPSVIDYDTSK